jgi:hypothetical protein
MKKIIVMALSLIMISIMVSIMVGCGNKGSEKAIPVAGGTNMPNNSNIVEPEKTQGKIIETNTSIDIDKVKEKYPEFFEIDGEPFKGIELYVWQMAEGTYYCGLMFGANRNKLDEEIWTLQEKALSVDETKYLLNEIGVCKDFVVIYPIAQPYSSYFYEIDDEYRNKVSDLFEGNFHVMGKSED